MRTTEILTADEAEAVLALAAAAETADGVAPLNDDARIALTTPDGERHVLAEADGRLVGYGILDRHGSGQLVVHPGARRRGLGRSVVAALGDGVEQYWAFGNLPAARGWATAEALTPARQLLIMRRDLVAHPAQRLVTEAVIRPFTQPDLGALLAVNAAAFAHHPEQGDLDAEHFAALADADWFRADDLLLAELDGRLVGFHWTKRHGGGRGEVYVLGVHPDAEGRGLGRALLDAGLAHLADVGCHEVILYVDGAETRPVRLYESGNFGVFRRDIAWRRQEGAR